MSNIILAIDTSVHCCSIAIYKNNYTYHLSKKCKNKHTKIILPMLQQILLQTKTKLGDLNYIAFAKGPGSFTGLRIAASIAQSLSFTLQIPIMSISTAAIMAEKTWRKYKQSRILVLINAKKKDVYWAEYKRNEKYLWIGENTEIFVEETKIEKKINNLKKKWVLISNEIKYIQYKDHVNIHEIKCFSPDAQDIIPFILLNIKEEKKYHIQKNQINYLDHFYQRKN